MDDQARSIVGREVSHYRVLSEIGRGAMGVVYEAEDVSLGRRVALKSLTERPTDDRAIRRFEREARMASALNHPNICTIHDFGEIDGLPFLVMERLEGEPLKARTGRQPLPVADVVRIATQVASALEAAHGKGIVHRDIKPANVFLCASGLVKLLDFGIAKVVAAETELEATVVGDEDPPGAPAPTDDLTMAGAMMGTVAYMAPEQIRAAAIDARTDVFACGVLFYEMAAGRRPFPGHTLADISASVLHTVPPAPSSINPEVPAALDRLIACCLEKDPARRFASGRELRAALVALDEKEDGPAPADAGPRRARKAPGRRTTTTRRRKGAIDTIAVLPFENRSGDPDADFVSEGIADSLTNSLSAFDRVRVAASSLVAQYRGRAVDPRAAGAELGVRAVVTGHATRRESTLAVGVELVDAEDGSQLWGRLYRRDMTDVMRLLEDLPAEIAEALKLPLAGGTPRRSTAAKTTSPRAYELYLRGRHHWNQRTTADVRAAIEYFNQAIAEDPRFAIAHAGLADCYTVLCFYDAAPPVAVCPPAKAAAAKALELDPELGEAHASAGMLWAIWDFDWAQSERSLLRAIELRPGYASAHHWYAACQSALGRHDAAAASIGKALELEPLAIAINADAGLAAYRARQFDAAEARCLRMLEYGPAFATAAHHVLGRCALQRHNPVQAATEFGLALASSPSSLREPAWLALARAIAGHEADARAALAALEAPQDRQFVPAFYRALVHLGLGEIDEAFAALSAACDERYPQVAYLKSDPVFDLLHPDPRYAGLLVKAGLARP